MPTTENIEKLKISLGLSANSAKIYLAALENGGGTLTELARDAGLARTVMTKPIVELSAQGLLEKQQEGKRIKYYASNPQELPRLIERKKAGLEELSKSLLQQISSPEKDLQIRWYSGIAGIKTAIREFFKGSKGNYRQFENADTYQYLGTDFGDEIVAGRLKSKKTNKLIVIGNRESTGWYKNRVARAKEELRELIIISSDEYPFRANIAVSDNMTITFEYQKKPFAILIDNSYVAQSIASIHEMIWDKYIRY